LTQPFSLRGVEEMFEFFIGVDPGVSGAIAVLSENGIAAVYDYPRDNPRKLMQIYKGLNTPGTVAVLEKIMILPGAGREQLYETFYWHKFCLDYFGIEYKTVMPNSWKKEYNLQTSKKKKEGQDNKTDAYNTALTIIDGAGKYLRTKTQDHNRADALLIANYCRRIN
jgi:hypothetical protein